MEVKISAIRQLCASASFRWTDHAMQRLIKRGISPDEVIEALLHGDIIEQYPTDYPYPSCLVFAMVRINRPLHVVCSIGEGRLIIITAYVPDKERWDTTFTRRKGEAD